MRAAFKPSSAEEGEKRLGQIARQLEHGHSPETRSLRGGMKEMFTLQRLKIPASLHKRLAAANLIASRHSSVRNRTHNVCRWRNADMVERWAVSAWLLAEEHFRRIDGHQELWTLAALLGRATPAAKKRM
jgi:hypothetical protein